MTSENTLNQITFPEPKTPDDWKRLVESMKNAQVEDYPGLDSLKFAEFKTLLSRWASNKLVILWLILGAIPPAMLILTEKLLGVAHWGGIAWLAAAFCPMLGAVFGGMASRNAQARILTLGREMELFKPL